MESALVAQSHAALRTQQQTPVDFSRRFPIQPAAALAPKLPRPPTSGSQRWAGSTSTLIAPPPPPDPHANSSSDHHERFHTTLESRSQRRVLTGYPSHTTQRASQRLRVRSADVDQHHQQSPQTHDVLPVAPSEELEPHRIPPHPESKGTGAAHVDKKTEEEVSFTPSPAGAGFPSDPPDEAIARHHQSSSNRSSPRGQHQGGGLFPQLRSPVSHRPQSNASMLYAPDHHLVRTSSRGGALSANTVARVERSEQRKVLLEQQLALERAYWNTKSAFQGLRAQAEQHIYARELTALWTERTDKSPYWKDQVQGLQQAQHNIDQWRRHPEYVTSPKRQRGKHNARADTTTAAMENESSAALLAAFPQSIAWAATATCTSTTHDHLRHRPLDHRINAAPLVPQSSWRAAIPMYNAQPPTESPERVKSLRSSQRSPRSPLSPPSDGSARSARSKDEQLVDVAPEAALQVKESSEGATVVEVSEAAQQAPSEETTIDNANNVASNASP
ncbi:Hypothetical protein, putative [Bodo saltans]|uniref:Uncharacterized protein n=1 Tax=Bodo saltans TaxID=75058 RepID=A0A0S4JSS0_BODSA|nr:Hypothetical protein, putative [Bodo saltans]|eukprot:CUG91590.1 Hypothetical protein, putative [Bodo saltans]